jgi:hypothetical protein
VKPEDRTFDVPRLKSCRIEIERISKDYKSAVRRVDTMLEEVKDAIEQAVKNEVPVSVIYRLLNQSSELVENELTLRYEAVRRYIHRHFSGILAENAEKNGGSGRTRLEAAKFQRRPLTQGLEENRRDRASRI